MLALVCKRWRAVANDPSWKPAVVAYGWGAARVAGVGRAAARPALLPLSLGVQLRSLCCGHEATYTDYAYSPAVRTYEL